MNIALEGFTTYPQSIQHKDGCPLCMAKGPEGDVLLVVGGDLGFEGEPHQAGDTSVWVAPKNAANAARLRTLFPFTAPRQGLADGCSVGVGDRLGIATPGHLRVFSRRHNVFPVLAQQSIRELNLTKRTYEDVLNAASFAVFREGFTRGFGADGDHLKTREEISYALDCGFSMITLDCSEYIRGDVMGMSLAQIKREHSPDQEAGARYVNRTFALKDGQRLTFDEEAYLRASLIYDKAIAFIEQIYRDFIKGQPVDFEISIDETNTPTSPLQHFYVASELMRRGITYQSLAPRFCGEFQKGIDYIGDLAQFEEELSVHAAIARHFGYKISVHSGSDKFSVFPAVGRQTQGVFHLKTAGTNWLEAVRLIAMKDPALYRKIHAFALEAYEAASKYYHVKGHPQAIPSIDNLPDEQLPHLMDQEDARQVLHITYGLILTAKGEDGSPLFQDALYELWDTYAEDYAALVYKHIGRHVDLLMGKA